MNGNRQVELHYINTGFPYTVTESLMNLFEGLSYGPSDPLVAAIEGFQENAYWQSYSGSYKYVPGGSSHFGFVQPPEEDDYLMRNGARIAFENTFMPNDRNQTPQGSHEGGVSNAGHRGTAHIGSSSQINFQDNINPDDMTYEELLDLGEAIGSQSRGLSKERIALLPVSKYRKGSFLLWKRSRDER
ncbi:hypothetical protein Scep_014238 [Stephania cephalantha]|uniref:Uncharacterized protein n=1 Tax=Stephania cephalantha TaxID=152367 RepID=A0AAP0NZ77_9MAGN